MSEAGLPSNLPPPRKGRWWVVVTLLVLLPLAALAGLYVYVSLAAEADLRDAIAEANQLEPRGWRLPDLEAQREVPDNDKNSAAQVLAVRALLPVSWGQAPAFYELFDDLRPEARLNEPQAAALRAELQKATAVLPAALKLETMPNGRYVVAWAPNPLDTDLPCQEARAVADLLRYDALLKSHDGDADAALRSVRASLNASRSIGDEPTGVSQLVRISGRAVALGSLERVLAQGEPSPDALAAVQQAVLEDERSNLLLFATRGERAVGFEMMLDLRASSRNSMGPLGPLQESLGFLKHQQAAMLRYTSRLAEIARLPVEEQPGPLRELKAQSDDLPLMAALLAPAIDKVADACRRSHAQMRCAAVALAAERYRRAKGHWPETLDALVEAELLSEVPADPYDGQPLRFVRLADGIVIYAVGPDGHDDGGTIDRTHIGAPGTDLGFRLWDVDRRRQPPLPPRPTEPAAPPAGELPPEDK
jgi:hypothetical protein